MNVAALRNRVKQCCVQEHFAKSRVENPLCACGLITGNIDRFSVKATSHHHTPPALNAQGRTVRNLIIARFPSDPQSIEKLIKTFFQKTTPKPPALPFRAFPRQQDGPPRRAGRTMPGPPFRGAPFSLSKSIFPNDPLRKGTRRGPFRRRTFPVCRKKRYSSVSRTTSRICGSLRIISIIA